MLSDQPFSLLIKPASADCNQQCTYCFYLSHAELYPGRVRRMSLKNLEQLILGYLKTRQPHYIFTWQGGEPTLMGVNFFSEAVKLQKKNPRPGSVVANGLQTNATLMEDEFAEFLARHNFLLGVSLDGPADIHDRYRKHKNGTGSYQAVMNGINCLVRHDVDFNIVTLVSQANVKRGKDVYRFLCEKGFLYHQYVECVEFDDKGKPRPFAITGEEWGTFLCDIFDEWIKSDIRRVSIRLFDAILTSIVEKHYAVCSMGPACGQYFVVENNGDIYPWDFFVRENMKIGNINDGSWQDARESSGFRDFVLQKKRWNSQCEHCEFLVFYFGDCPKNRFRGRNSSGELSWLCRGWKIFYRHALLQLQVIADKIIQERMGINLASSS